MHLAIRGRSEARPAAGRARGAGRVSEGTHPASHGPPGSLPRQIQDHPQEGCTPFSSSLGSLPPAPNPLGGAGPWGGRGSCSMLETAFGGSPLCPDRFSIHRAGAPGSRHQRVVPSGPWRSSLHPLKGPHPRSFQGGLSCPARGTGTPPGLCCPDGRAGQAARRLPLCRGSVFRFQNGHGDQSGCPFQMREARRPEVPGDPTGRGWGGSGGGGTEGRIRGLRSDPWTVRGLVAPDHQPLTREERQTSEHPKAHCTSFTAHPPVGGRVPTSHQAKGAEAQGGPSPPGGPTWTWAAAAGDAGWPGSPRLCSRLGSPPAALLLSLCV